MDYWLVVYLPLWKMMEFVSWDDDIPNWMESYKSHGPNHQPGLSVSFLTVHSELRIAWMAYWLNSVGRTPTNLGSATQPDPDRILWILW